MSERQPTIKEILHTADGIGDKAMEAERTYTHSEVNALVAAAAEKVRRKAFDAANTWYRPVNQHSFASLLSAILALELPNADALERLKAEVAARARLEESEWWQANCYHPTNHPEPCKLCQRTAANRAALGEAGAKACWKCHGSGKADNAQFSCSACHGTGKAEVIPEICGQCGEELPHDGYCKANPR